MQSTQSEISIEEVDKQTYASSWGEFGDNLFVNALWVDPMSVGSGSPVYLHFISNGKAIGKIAGLEIQGSWLQGRQLYFYSSPVLLDFDDQIYQQSLACLKQYTKKRKCTRLSIRPWDQEPAVTTKCKKLNPTSTNEYVIDVTKPDFACNVSGRIMKNIKKGKKAGASVRVSTDEADLELLLSFLESTRTRRISKFGSVYSPYYVFNLCRQTIKGLLKSGMGSLICADLDGRTYSILLLVTQGERSCCLLKGSHPDAYKNGLSSFVDFETVEYLNNHGVKWLNLGPELVGEEGKGLNQYKEGICAVAKPRFGFYTYTWFILISY